uniref:60S acidic ribosomal protein P0 n=1 Tax=Phallusia mammillata TaxID=59560 RepID=A0A6F9DQL3_9ASCI|nr:60S acidic ribosomal protein P0 [Phallusia mammillata]
MPREDRKTWKAQYFIKIVELLDEYPKCLIVGADNVSSKQMQQIRASMRDKAVILMGKNTMMRKAIKGHLNNNPDLEKLLPHIKGNIGLVFTKEDLIEVRDLLLANKVAAPAKANAIAPNDVIVPAQNTGLGPEKTSFFQALAIPTKISRGTIEIISNVHLIKPGDKVGASDATLLNMLKIYPFSYGLELEQVYDSGTCFSPEILDITDDDIRKKFLDGVRNVASVCLSIGYPTVASVPHSIINGFKNLLAVAAETEITFPEAEKMKAYLADPSAFASAAPVAAAEETKEEEKPKEESEEESDDDMGFGLFD